MKYKYCVVLEFVNRTDLLLTNILYNFEGIVNIHRSEYVSKSYKAILINSIDINNYLNDKKIKPVKTYKDKV